MRPRWPFRLVVGFMKYDGSGGVRALYSSIRLRYVRWTARIFVGSTGARKAASASEIRVPSSSTTSPPSRRPQRGSPLPLGDDVDVEIPDGFGEALHLEALHRQERGDELRPDGVDEPGIRFERVERAAEIGRQLRSGVGVVGAVRVPDDGFRWRQAALDPVETRAQDRGRDQVCAGGAVAGANLDPRAGAALARDTAEGCAVVVAPVRMGWRQAVREEPLVRVDGRPEQRLQAVRMLDHTGDEVAGERAQPLGPTLVGKRVVTVAGGERDMQVEA